jgi:hypothetical protein
MGITAGPKVPKVRGRAAAGIEGKMSYQSGKYRIDGELQLVSERLSSGYIEYTTPSALRFGGKLDLSIKGFGFEASLENGQINGTSSFSATGKGKVKAFGKGVSGSGTVTNRGVGACAPGGFGFAWRWGGTPNFGCDIGPIRPSSAVRRAQDGPRTITLSQGLPHALLRVKGDGGPPSLRITGPDRRSVDVAVSGEGSSVDQNGIYAFRRDEDATTYVLLDRPPGGNWGIELLAGSAPVRSVGVANGILPPRVTGSVKRKGRSYLLAWKLRAAPGRQVQFFEVSPGVRRLIATTARATGTKAFRPAKGRGSRQIVALVEQNSLPRATFQLARFKTAR